MGNIFRCERRASPANLHRYLKRLLNVDVVSISGVTILEIEELDYHDSVLDLRRRVQVRFNGKTCRLLASRGKLLLESLRVDEAGILDGSTITAVVVKPLHIAPIALPSLL